MAGCTLGSPALLWDVSEGVWPLVLPLKWLCFGGGHEQFLAVGLCNMLWLFWAAVGVAGEGQAHPDQELSGK